MEAPKFSAMFSLFRSNAPKGFHLATRYYDPLKEEREERMERLRKDHAAGNASPAFDRELMKSRMRHSWQRQSSGRTQLVRLVLIMAVVLIILYYLILSFGLLERWNG